MYFKKISSFLLAAALIVSAFTGCQAQPSESSASETESSKSEQSSVSSEEGKEEKSMDGDAELSAPGEFPIVIGDKVSVSVFTTPHTDANTEFDSSINPFSAWLEDLTNVHIDWTVVTSADKQAKLNLLFQSNSYEDIIFNSGWDCATQLTYGSQGYIVPLNEYLENDAFYYNEYKKAGLDAGEFSQRNIDVQIMPNGDIYSVGKYANAFHSGYASRVWIYQPWLDTLGLETPTTTDEFYEAMTAFKNGDPNGNGKADEIPISSFMTGWNSDPTEFFFNSFVYYTKDTRCYVDDGEVKFAFTQDAYKEGLKYLHKLTSEGLYYDGTFVQDAATSKQLTTAEPHVVGVTAGGGMTAFANVMSGQEGDWVNWKPLAPLEGPEGVQYTRYFTPDFNCGGNITDLCEYKRVAFRLLDSLYKTEVTCGSIIGVEGVHYKFCTDGEMGINGKPARYLMIKNDRTGNTETNYMWGQIGPASMPPTWHSGQAVVGGDPALDTEAILYQAGLLYSEYKPDESILLPQLIFDEDDSTTVVTLKTEITSYLDTSIAKFMTEGGIDENWDQYLADLEARGASELLEIYQKAYEQRMATLG